MVMEQGNRHTKKGQAWLLEQDYTVLYYKKMLGACLYFLLPTRQASWVM